MQKKHSCQALLTYNLTLDLRMQDAVYGFQHENKDVHSSRIFTAKSKFHKQQSSSKFSNTSRSQHKNNLQSSDQLYMSNQNLIRPLKPLQNHKKQGFYHRTRKDKKQKLEFLMNNIEKQKILARKKKILSNSINKRSKHEINCVIQYISQPLQIFSHSKRYI